jgi:NADH-quinone oxidoreductase subunit J
VGGYFYLFALIALICATGVITQRQAVYSALFFVIVVLSVAGLLLLLGAEFLAAALVIVYAGAILVTYVFVIMLASQTGESLYDRRARAPLAACLVGFVLVGTVGGALAEYESSADTPAIAATQLEIGEEVQAVAGNTESLGAQLMTRYMLVLEVAGVLLLLAMVGAIAIARKQFPGDREVVSAERPEIGEAGRTAAPF